MNCAIVLAGGKGTRMNSEIPKQFLVVGGKPLISYSLDVFEKSPFIDAIIIVTSQDYTGYMKALVKENGYKKIAGIALGGKERYDSVHSGLELLQTLMSSGGGKLSGDEEWLSGEDYIFIHDGARPCVTAQIICNCMQFTDHPEDYRIIDYDGTVYNENIGAGESVETALNYVMSYEDYTRNGVIDINVKSLGENPHSMLTTDKQTLKRIIDNALKENEDKAVIELPDTINNTSVTYAYVQSQTGSKNNLLFAAIIVIAVIVLIYYKKKTKAKEEQKLRQKQLQYDYSEVISKLTLLLGAGMTVRRAWEKMIEDYMRKKKSAKDERIVYEQMYITDCQIKSGISEYKAYEEFGHRCQTREYLKLASLLQTNIKKGTKELKELLYQESYDAFEQRKSLAVKKGEEAATRLLMPMFMLLIVVMIIVMVPAVISFQV